MRPKRENVTVGASLISEQGLMLDSYRMLFGLERAVVPGTTMTVLTLPRKKEGINLVRVKLSDRTEGEVFYCDILKFTRLP